MGYPPGWAPPGYGPPGYPPHMPMPMAAPPGWPPGYPMPQMMPGYPVHYPGAPMPFPLPPVAPAAPPMAQPVVEAQPVLVATPVVEPARPPAADVPLEAQVHAVIAEAAPAHEHGMVPVLRLNPGTAAATRGPNGFVRVWKKIGVGSLMFSLLVHGGLLFVAGLVAFTVSMQESAVDFLPGGGTQPGAAASAALSEQVQLKARRSVSKTMPKSRLVSNSVNASLTLPEAPPDMIEVPDLASALGGGRLGSSGHGFGGAGGGFGNGLGTGALSGVTFKPLMMFGVELKDTRKIAVVMDVSRSMTRYLPIVVKELDKVARGSVVVMYFGCGLANPPRRKSDVDDKVRKAEGDDFASFWQNWEGDTPVNLPQEDRKKLRYDPAKKMPLDDIYQMLARRPSTYYLDFSGIGYAWTALMSNEVKEADAVYWFADFQDKVDEDQMDAVRRRFKARKQKLFIHASTRGRFFEQVRDNLVLPLDGEVIETELPKK